MFGDPGLMRTALFALALALLSGCTSAVVEGSKPKEVRVGADAVVLKLVSASILENNSDKIRRVHLCFKRTILPDGPETSVLVSLAPFYSFATERGTYFPFREEGGNLVLETNGSALFEGCETPTGRTFIRQLPIIEADGDQKVALPENQKDAIVVAYHGRNAPGIGYISAARVFGEHHSFSVDLSQSPLYVEYKDARPYLLLLTPVTVAGDAVLMTSLFFSVVTVSAVCPHSFERCR
jgi:hypothetical protein